MRVSLVLLVIIASATPAIADPELVIIGPAAIGKTTGVPPVKQALAKAAIAPLSERTFDATCASDPGCLVKTGGDVRARKLLAVTVTDGSSGTLTIGLAYVDVVGKELVAMRDVAIAEKNLAKELGPAVSKFVAEAPTERAKVLFADGNQHYNLGEFGQALELYKRAYRIKPLAAFQFNIAQCHRKLGQYRDAIAMYQAYLVDVPGAANRTLAENLIAESKAALEKQERDAARSQAERLAAEQKRAEELRKAKEAEAVTAGEQRKTEQARLAAEREQEARYNRHPARKWMLVTGGVGIAAMITGGVFAVSARSAQASFSDAGCGDPSQGLIEPALAQCREDLDRGERNALLGNAFLIGGGAILAASALVFVLDPGNLERPGGGKERRPVTSTRTRIGVTPGSVQMVVQW